MQPHTMPRPEPSLVSPSPTELASAELADQDFSFEDLRIRKPPLEWTTTAIVSCVVAWGALAVHNLIAMPKLDGVPPVSFDRVANSRKGVPRYVIVSLSVTRVVLVDVLVVVIEESPKWLARAAFWVLTDETPRSSSLASTPRSLLFALRFGTFLFGVFFCVYHLGYENVKKHTDGFEYLSDWTFVLLCFTEGALAWCMQGVEPSEGAYNARTNVLVILYGVCWSSNLVASAGAWYSFFFYPMCMTLEGVNNYPACYFEWYRLSEHALNLVILVLEYAFGVLPMRRRDFGWSILFLQAYIFVTWINFYCTGDVTYDMFSFAKGLVALAWYNAVFFGTALAFLFALKLHQPKGYRTNGRAGLFTYERVAGDESRPLTATSS